MSKWMSKRYVQIFRSHALVWEDVPLALPTIDLASYLHVYNVGQGVKLKIVWSMSGGILGGVKFILTEH